MKSRYKSKTNWFALALTGMGALQANFPMLREQAGEFYPYIFIGIGIVVALLREVTSEPVA